MSVTSYVHPAFSSHFRLLSRTFFVLSGVYLFFFLSAINLHFFFGVFLHFIIGANNFPGTGSIGGIHLPDFNDKYVFSKKKSGVSDEDYRKQIREQAYEDFAKGQFQNKSEGFNRLMKSYTSEVSPDRKGIITSGLKAVSENRQNVLKPIDFVATLLEGKVKYQKLPSGNSDYIEFYDKNGEMVATYSNNGWTMYTTNAEASRQTEMCMIYNEAWGNAKRGIPLMGEEMVNGENSQNGFDAKA